MTFTLFSVILLICVLIGAVIEALRGMKRGFARTMIGVAVALTAAIGGAVLAGLLSNPPARRLTGFVMDRVPALASFNDKLPHAEDVAYLVVDCLLTAVLFIPVFLLLRLILRCIASVLCRRLEQSIPAEADFGGEAFFDPRYEGKDIPWHRKHDRLLGGVTGGVLGFLVAVLLLSPVLGLLSSFNILLDNFDRLKVKVASVPNYESTMEVLDPYINDGMAALLSGMGGNLFFDAVARSSMEGENVALRREIEHDLDVIATLFPVLQVLPKIHEATPEEREVIENIGDSMGSTPVLRRLSADFLATASEAWLNGKSYLSIKRPRCGELIDPVVDKALQVCRNTTPEHVGADMTTIINIYLIAADAGLIGDPDTENLLEIIDKDNTIDKIYAELQKNPRMAHLCQEVTRTAMKLMATSIDWAGISNKDYGDLMSNLSEALNLVNGMKDASLDEQLGTLTDYTLHYANQYGVEMPGSIAQMAASTLLEQFGGSDRITADMLEDYLNYFATSGS